MDIVRRSIDGINGRVEVRSQLGQGTEFVLRIPLTLAIIEGMLVRVHDTYFTIPVLQIRESVRVRSGDITQLTTGQEMVKIRDQLLPVLRLQQFYRMGAPPKRLEDGIVMVVEDGGDLLCLFVDELIGQRQTVIKSLSGVLADVRGLSGCSVLGDGRISLILEPRASKRRRHPERRHAEPTAPPPRRARGRRRP